jgi:hypothetical protein
VGVDRLLLQLGVFEHPARALHELISGLLAGGHLGRHVLGEDGLGVTSRNCG